MNEIFVIKGIEIGNIYNFTCEDMVLKPTVVELEQGGLLGGLADWAVNPSTLSPGSGTVSGEHRLPLPSHGRRNLGGVTPSSIVYLFSDISHWIVHILATTSFGSYLSPLILKFFVALLVGHSSTSPPHSGKASCTQ